jgi:hypothetical protein
MNALMATRRQARELVDGTIEVKLHIDPRYKGDFHKLFPEIDMPVALAPITPQAANEEAQQETIAKGGAMARLAGIWCADPLFWQWLREQRFDVENEKEAAEFVRFTCGIESRAELDSNDEAAAIFLQEIRGPYMQWLEQRK